MKNPVRVALVEDDALLRRRLAELMDNSPGFVLAAAFADGAEALRGMAAAQAEVVLLDIRMPRMTGVECAARLREL